MNEGTLSLIIQWCLLCLIWMGSLDRPLLKMGVTRAAALSALSLFLVCSFVSWKLYFLPVEVSISGALLPALSAGWLYAGIPRQRRRMLLIAALLTAVLLSIFRLLLFKDPVLLVLDETSLIAGATLAALFTLTRDLRQQLCLLFLILPLTDGLHVLSFLPRLERGYIGSEYAQDMLWSTLMLWGGVLAVWGAAKKGRDVFYSVRSKSDSRR